MKEKIHPKFSMVEVSCACGNKFMTGTTKKAEVIKVDVCNECHPFYTGKQKMIDTGGRIDKFRKRFNIE